MSSSESLFFICIFIKVFPRLCPVSTAPVSAAMMVAAPITAAEITMGRHSDPVWSTTTPASGGPKTLNTRLENFRNKVYSSMAENVVLVHFIFLVFNLFYLCPLYGRPELELLSNTIKYT